MQNSQHTATWGNTTGKRPEDVAPDAGTLAIWQENNCRAFGGEIVDVELTLAPGGVTRHYRSIIAPVRDGKEISGVLGVNINITDQKEFEQRLRESEQRFRDLADLLPQTVCETDRNGVLQWVNAKGFEMFGYDRQDLQKGFSVLDMIAEQDRSRALKKVGEILDGRESSGNEYTGLRKDGTTFPIRAYSSAAKKDGEPSGLRLIVVDITAEKESEQHLRASEARYRDLFENASDLIQSVNIDGSFVFVNQAWLHKLGYSKDELSNLRLADILRPDQVDHCMQILARVCGGEDCDKIETVFLTKDRQEVHVEGNVNAQMIDGVFVATRGIFRDITDRKRAEQESKRAKSLAEVDRLKTILLASVSHELRTPITCIKGLASSLTQPDVSWSDEDQREFLHEIEQAADRLTRLVEDLIDMSQLECGSMHLEMVPAKLSTIINQVSAQLATVAAGHDLQVAVSPDLPRIYCDPTRIAQLITNLVSNAASYSDEGTTITITARESDGYVEVSVIDEGDGIPPEELDSIFDRFHRLGGGRERRKDGSGLGLAICKNIVEVHGGTIWAKSQMGQGSRFTFTVLAQGVSVNW